MVKMRNGLSIIAFFSALILSTFAWAGEATVHHAMDITLDPQTSHMSAQDEITIPESLRAQETLIKLNADLAVRSLQPGVTLTLVEEDAKAADVGIDRDNDDPRASVKVNLYRVNGLAPTGEARFTLSLSGKIHNPILQLGAEYARGFSQSPGLIDQRGVYLAGSTFWVPYIEDQKITYDIDVTLPEGWRSASQGKRTNVQDKDGTHLDTWVVDTPTEEIYLIAAEFTEYSYTVGAVEAMAFLRTPDATLANTYLETTAQYLEMYRTLVGPYPYSKFALVENYWETGYGMPSFTLLGSEIIRFPFILHSSYPHELLHNWWGNGVFVDFETGNWCEGLTAYMADQLVAEQRQQGAEYRRSILQRYTDYVDDSNDFPLTQFRSRYNAPSEAVGYGKSSMTWNMLRETVGDDMFVRGFQTFYRDNKFKTAGFDDIRKSFEKVSGKDLTTFFDQWVKRTGSLVLELNNTKVKSNNGAYTLSFDIAQTQTGDAYKMDIPVAVYTKEGAAIHKVAMSEKAESFTLNLEDEPLRVVVDPEFDLFRRLHYSEVPPSLSKMFGADQILLVLPANTSAERRARYDALSTLWASEQGGKVEVVTDADIETLPVDKAVWVLGLDNRFKDVITAGVKNYDVEIKSDAVRFKGTELATDSNSFIISVRNPGNPEAAVVWLTVDRLDAVEGLARKLPHYGKYSYLAFTGAEPTNVAKGEWPVVNSPLVAILSDEQSTAVLAKRPALAELAPVFSGEMMAQHVTTLAAEEMEGRGPGSQGIDLAADYIAAQFKEYGLEPAGDDGTYFQSFTATTSDDQREVTIKNVVAVLPGTNTDWADQSVVVSAHYDHLGHGWPGVRTGNEGMLHPGADDNASGVAVMLELAKNLSQNLTPKRSIVFAAFTGEESGLLGSRHYVENTANYPAGKTIGNVNLDTIGRLGDNPVIVFGAPSAKEWQFIFMGATAVTGVQTEIVTNVVNASDHVAFDEAGVPAVQLFSGTNGDYHRPSDTADKIDPAGMVKVASIAREAIQYLSEREEPLTFKGTTAPQAPAAQGPGKARSVSTGTVPDFAFSGAGVKLSSVAEGSPAEAAGLKAGDVIIQLGDTAIDGLQAYSDTLKTFEPGDVVELRYRREGEEHQSSITLAAR